MGEKHVRRKAWRRPEDRRRKARSSGDELAPEGYQLKTMVDVMIHNHWLLKRAQRRLQETEVAIAGEDDPNAVEWTAAGRAQDRTDAALLNQCGTSFLQILETVQNLLNDMLRDKLKIGKMLSHIEDLEAQVEKSRKQEAPAPERGGGDVAEAAGAPSWDDGKLQMSAPSGICFPCDAGTKRDHAEQVTIFPWMRMHINEEAAQKLPLTRDFPSRTDEPQTSGCFNPRNGYMKEPRGYVEETFSVCS